MEITEVVDNKERLNKSLSVTTEKLIICVSKFENWSIPKEKNIAKILSEETGVEAQKVEISRQREQEENR